MLTLCDVQSRTYGMLFDFETRIWAEGPDYLRGFWERVG